MFSQINVNRNEFVFMCLIQLLLIHQGSRKNGIIITVNFECSVSQDEVQRLKEMINQLILNKKIYLHGSYLEGLQSYGCSKFVKGPAWPPRSPDLNPFNFYLWGHMKSLVYEDTTNSRYALLHRVLDAAE